MWNEYMNVDNPDKICQHCKEIMWNAERNNKSIKNHSPTFFMYCRNGKVALPIERQPPPYLAELLNSGPKTTHYKKTIQIYNSLYMFTSL